MINANELRRGNYFLYGKENLIDKMFTLTFDREDGLLINEQIPESHLQPIPLTPEILIAAGFRQSLSRKNNFHINGLKYCYSIKHREFNIKTNESCYIRITDIENVHQLQNLYFALTGKELEIKILTPAAP